MVEMAVENKTGAEGVIWDLSVFYAGMDDPKIEQDKEELEHLVDDFVSRYKGRVATLTPVQMRGVFEALEAIYDLEGRLGAFASLNYSTNTTNPQYGAFYQKMNEYGATIEQKLVFFRLEWNNMDDDKAQALINDPEIGRYAYHLEVARLRKPYQLTEPEEQIVMEKDVTGNVAWVRLFQQIMGSMRYEFEGEKLAQQTLLAKLHSTDREVRRKAADALTEGLHTRLMELTYIFNVLAADKAAGDKRRGYPTWISSRNLSNKAPDEIVEALINTVTSNYTQVARHYNLKRILLGYEELYDYDRYASLPVQENEKFYTWNEAKDIVLTAFSNFSPKMGDIAREFFDNNWIHAPVVDGKRGGAFASWTVPSAHPFVFVNYTGTANDVMTLAHELGHGIHMYLSRPQGVFGLATPLTTAETASVFGEMLVFQDLMAKEENDAVKLSMLAKKLEDTFATVYRQTAMNRFEHAMHTGRREEGELTSEQLSDIWMETQNAMFGGSVNLRPDYAIWWSYIPHFLHTPGYVYAYAFGELLVLALYEVYKEQGEAFVPKYLELLSSGDSDYPANLLAKLGIDLNDPNFWQKGIDVISQLVDQEEALAKSVYPEKF